MSFDSFRKKSNVQIGVQNILKVGPYLSFFSPAASSKEAARWFAVQSELARTVAGHSDSHEPQQDGHAWHHRRLPALQHRLGCLSLKERAGVTSREAATTSTSVSLHCWGVGQHIRGLPLHSGRRGVLKEATLFAHLPQPGHGLAIGEEAHSYLHFVHVPVCTEPPESHSVSHLTSWGPCENYQPIPDIS